MLHIHEYERIRALADGIRRMCEQGVKTHDTASVNSHIGLQREITRFTNDIDETLISPCHEEES